MNTVIDLKKLLIGGSVALLLVPVFAFAAYNDVTLTTDTVVLSVNGITVNVTGASAEIESIVVSSTDFTVTLASGSSIDMTAPNLNVFSVNTVTDQVTNVCTSAQSKLGYLATGALTLVVTPQTSLCASATGSVGTSTGGGAGGDVRALQQFLNPNGFRVTESGPGSPGNETIMFGGLTRAALAAFQAANGISPAVGYFGPKTRAFVNSGGIGASTSTPSTPSAPTPSSSSFTRDLDIGAMGEDVRALQQFLNAQGFMIAESGVGSPGNETDYFGSLTQTALGEFQAANGITPSVGYFGPKTRAFIAEM